MDAASSVIAEPPESDDHDHVAADARAHESTLSLLRALRQPTPKEAPSSAAAAPSPPRATALDRAVSAAAAAAAGTPPPFQRVVIAGESVLSEEEISACAQLTRALALRRKHAWQKPAEYWGALNTQQFEPAHDSKAAAAAGGALASPLSPQAGAAVVLLPEIANPQSPPRKGHAAAREALPAAAQSAVAAAGASADAPFPEAAPLRAIPSGAFLPGSAPPAPPGVVRLTATHTGMSLVPPVDPEDATAAATSPSLHGSALVTLETGLEYGQLFYRRRLEPHFAPFAAQLPPASPLRYEWRGGVVAVLSAPPAAAAGGGGDGDGGASLYPVPSFTEFRADHAELLRIVHAPAVRSFAFARLELLAARFRLHRQLNAAREAFESKTVPHRDFYNVRKVDTHVHHSACMNAKHLLSFIKRKLKTCPDEVVIMRDGVRLTLRQVFESLHLTAYDLSVDTLDVHAAQHETYQRFDRFNL